MKLNFKGKYFDGRENAVHVEDEYVQKMIDSVVDRLLNSNESFDMSLSSTGDTLVIGIKSDDDYESEINIYVTQDYSEACLLKDAYGHWEPIAWGYPDEPEEYMEMTKDELIEEIMRLKRAEYDPKREV